MLVISQNIVLSEEDDALPDGTPLILYENLVTTGNITATSEDDSYPVTNLANPSTNQEWRGEDNSPTPTTIEIDVTVDSSTLIDGFGIARHNFGTEGIAVAIYSVSTDSPPVETLIAGPQIPPTDQPMLFVGTPQTFNKVRIELTVPASTVPRAGVLYVGPLLRCQRGFDINTEFTPPQFSRRTVSVNGKSQAGDFLGRIITSQSIEGATATWRHFTPDWYRENFDPFVDAAQTDTPFFFAWAPDDYPYEVGYLWLADDPIPLLSPITGRFGIALRMDGIVS